jgi:formylglycine-generating enzyme required for sulfatase activity
VPARGIGCFFSGAEQDLGSGFASFLNKQALVNHGIIPDTITPYRTTKLLSVPSNPLCSNLPAGMVEIPAATLDLSIEMRVRECGFYESMLPAGEQLGDCYNFHVRKFQRRVAFQRFAMDETPVTNAQFAEFLKATGYRSKHLENFLKHWKADRLPLGKEEHPVVYVDLEDALLSGRSPFGCYDMCGNVWEWTESERSDGRTRFCVIRGGAWFAAKGSGWYMDGGPRPANFAAKFLLTWPGLDRSSTIGFRCAVTLSERRL